MVDLRTMLWWEKYRPNKIDDIILPDRVKQTFRKMIETGDIPHLLLVGTSGTGKTTIAKALANETNSDIMVINASEESGVDMLRDKVKRFVMTTSLSNDLHKLVLLDEADNLSTGALRALRGFIEEYHANARFIFTGNYKSKFPKEIVSRLQVVDFVWDKESKEIMMKTFFIKLMDICKKEGIQVTDGGKKATAQYIKNTFPDMRKILNDVALYSKVEKILDEGFVTMMDDNKYNEFYKALKEKNFSAARAWIRSNAVDGPVAFYTKLKDDIDKVFKKGPSIGKAYEILQQMSSDAMINPIAELNLVACAIYLMDHCEFN